MKVCVFGLGYIGLPTASLLAAKGFQVCGVDIDIKTVDTINRGELPITEPDLDVLVRAAVGSGKLKASLDPEMADIFIIAVPTPFKEGFEPDLSHVEAAARAMAPYVKRGNLILLESTSPVGTTEKIATILQQERPDLSVPMPKSRCSFRVSSNCSTGGVYIAYCPERVLPGQILKELIENDRIIGGLDFASAQHAKDFYEKFITGKVRITDSRTAEMCKLAENAYRDVNIAFANELSVICDKLQINVWELIELANRHPRVNILRPGPGVGGHCIAIDPWFIIHAAGELSPLLQTARRVNDSKPEFVLTKIREKAARFINPVIACLGLAYKANVGDLRESPATHIVRGIAREQMGEIWLVEPNIDCRFENPGFENCVFSDLDTALNRADVVVLLTDHKEFADIDPGVLKEKVLIDTRGVWR